MAAATAGGVIAQQVASKAVRDALFLSSFRVRSLPLVMAVGAILSLAAVVAISRLMARYAPRRVLLGLFGLSGLMLAGQWLAISHAPRHVAVAVYLHVTVFNPVILSAFWSLVNEQYDPHTARFAVARIATGGTLGGVLGGLGAWRASTLVSVETAVLLLAVLNGLCLIGTLGIPRQRRQRDAPAAEDEPSKNAWAIDALFNAPYLRNLALLVALGAAMSSLLDYVFSAQVTAKYGSGPPLLAFFSLFGLGVSALSFLMQVSLGRVAMKKVGLAVNIAVLPGIILIGGAVGVAVPGLLSATLLRGAEMVQRNTLFRSAYELLYTPLEERQKRSAKALIDVGFDRLGSVVGSGVALGAAALFVRAQSVMLGAVLVFAAATLPLVRNLHAGYVAALKKRLREVEEALPPDADAAGPPRGFDENAGDALIEKVEQVLEHDDRPGPVVRALANRQQLHDSVGALLSDDVELTRRALEGWDTSKLPLVPFAILLLAREDMHLHARKALRLVANDVTGQLLDSLLDPKIDFVVRRRIPAVLSVCASQRAADGLLLGLGDERFEVRYSCVRALLKVADRGRDIVFVREKIIELITREIERATTAFSELDDGSEEEVHPLGLIKRDRVSRSVENLFSLLSLILERDGLRLCLSGLHDENDHHRGTALEYLHTVLPAELRDKLLPLLSEAGPIPSTRSPAELLARLTSTSIGRAFASGAPLSEQLQGCGEALVQMGAAFARIWLYDPTDDVLELRASAGMYTHIDGAHARVPVGTLEIGQIASSRQLHLTKEVIGDPPVPEQEWAKREGLVSFAGYPLVAGERLLGVVALFAKHKLSNDMLFALESVADQIALGIEGALRTNSSKQ